MKNIFILFTAFVRETVLLSNVMVFWRSLHLHMAIWSLSRHLLSKSYKHWRILYKTTFRTNKIFTPKIFKSPSSNSRSTTMSPNTRPTNAKKRRKAKIWTKSLVCPVTITPSTMRCPQQISTVPMFRRPQACTRMLKPVARPITFATTDVRDIRAPRSCAPTAHCSIKRSSLAIGGTMLIAARLPAIIS